MLLRAQRLESLGTLAGGIAHDLNNILAPILMSIELLREDETRPDRLDLLATVASSAERGADMVRQVLSFARGVPGTKTATDLRHVGRDVGRILRDTFPKNIEIELRFAEALWPLAADATQMHQVLMNLCVNARDAMPHGGKLELRIDNVMVDQDYADVTPSSSPGPHVLIEVTDSGVGILPEHQARLFEPFFTTKEVGSGSGSGLGLPTVHTIVRGHGGFITVYSEAGKGATFRVYLPAIAESAVAEKMEIDQRALPRGHGEGVLVVDDEPNVREMVRRILERFGYHVHLAANGAEAVALYAQLHSEIAVVLTDMSMPVMDGPATILALRALDPAVRIIGTSGLAANGQAAKAMQAGVRHFVPKPYTAETLLRVLRQALDDVESG
jgi:CheY-like chemotaxis protein